MAYSPVGEYVLPANRKSPRSLRCLFRVSLRTHTLFSITLFFSLFFSLKIYFKICLLKKKKAFKIDANIYHAHLTNFYVIQQ